MDIIKGVKVWGHSDEVELWVENGTLHSINPPNTAKDTPQNKVHSFKNTYVMPAGVDVQVHLRVPGQSEKEKPETGIRAALYGGYGAVLSMPNSKPCLDSAENLLKAQLEVKGSAQKYGIAAYFASCVSKNLEGKALAPLSEMAKAGALAFTDDGKGIEPDAFMEAGFKASIETGLAVLQHGEWPGHGGVLADSVLTRRLGLKKYDRKQEWGMVERDLKLLEKFPKAKYHVLHVTTRESVELVRRAKDKGLHVTAEASPHHLYFCVDDIVESNTSFKMNPPLHQAEDRAMIREALNEGVIDFVATDHAPHEAAAKNQGFEKSAFGTIGMESSLRVLLTGIQEGWLNPHRLKDIFSTAPAKLLGLEKEYGTLSPGNPFRAVFFQDTPSTTFALEDIQSLSKNSIFLGRKLRGAIVGHSTRNGLFKFD